MEYPFYIPGSIMFPPGPAVEDQLEVATECTSSTLSSRPISPNDNFQILRDAMFKSAIYGILLNDAVSQLRNDYRFLQQVPASAPSSAMNSRETSDAEGAVPASRGRRCRVRVQEMTEEELRRRHESRYAL